MLWIISAPHPTGERPANLSRYNMYTEYIITRSELYQELRHEPVFMGHLRPGQRTPSPACSHGSWINRLSSLSPSPQYNGFPATPRKSVDASEALRLPSCNPLKLHQGEIRSRSPDVVAHKLNQTQRLTSTPLF